MVEGYSVTRDSVSAKHRLYGDFEQKVAKFREGFHADGIEELGVDDSENVNHQDTKAQRGGEENDE